ncbi:hypothetical protein D3C81_1678550 [compost metagenome]
MHRGGGNTLADLQAIDALAERIDHAQCFAATGCRQRRLVAVQATHRQQVVVVDRGQHGADAHLAGAGFGQCSVGNGKDVGRVAEGGVLGSAHERCSGKVDVIPNWGRVRRQQGDGDATRHPATDGRDMT